MGVVHVRSHFQPVLGLIVSLEADGGPFEIRVVDYALIVEVAYGTIKIQIPGASCEAEVVLLTETVPERLVKPTVRRRRVDVAVVVESSSLCGVWIHPAVRSDEILPVRDGVGEVAESAVGGRPAKVGVGLSVSLVRGHSTVTHVVVVEGGPVHLVVLHRILHVVVVDCRAAVDAPAAVQRDRGLFGLAFLRGDHHDTVGSSGSVEGVGGGVLEHGDVLHIVRIQVVPASVVRSSVNDDQRGCPGIDGAESPDGHRRGGGRGAGAVGHLKAGHLALKSADHVRELLLLKGLALHYCRGAGEGGFGLLAESNDENLVKLLMISL